MPRELDQNKYFYAKTLLSQNLSIYEIRKELRKIFGSGISPNRLVELKNEKKEILENGDNDESKNLLIQKSKFKSKNFSEFTQSELFNSMIAKLEAKLDQQAILIQQFWNKFEKYGKSFEFWQKRFNELEKYEREQKELSDGDFLNDRKLRVLTYLSKKKEIPNSITISEDIGIDIRIIEIIMKELKPIFKKVIKSDTKLNKISTKTVRTQILQRRSQTNINTPEGSNNLNLLDEKENKQISENASNLSIKQVDGIYFENTYYQISITSGIKKLNLNSLGLNSLSELKNLSNLDEIQILDLSENNITKLDFTEFKNIKCLKSLQRLLLRYNQIEIIKGLEFLPNLQSIYLSGNNLSHLIDSGLAIKNNNLIMLDLSENNFTEIPELSGANSLLNLDLSYNKIEFISHLTNLINLTTLNLSHNYISEIGGLETLILLESLNIENNPVYAWIEKKYGQNYKDIAKNSVILSKNKK